MMIHRILEYLFYKIQVLTRYMDTSMYLNTHVPFTCPQSCYSNLVDAAIIYYYIIMGYSPQKNAANVIFHSPCHYVILMEQPLVFITGINIGMRRLWKEKYMNTVPMYGRIFLCSLLLSYY